MSITAKLFSHFLRRSATQEAERQILIEDVRRSVTEIRKGVQRYQDEQIALQGTFRDLRSVLNAALAEIEKGRPHNARTILRLLLGRDW